MFYIIQIKYNYRDTTFTKDTVDIFDGRTKQNCLQGKTSYSIQIFICNHIGSS